MTSDGTLAERLAKDYLRASADKSGTRRSDSEQHDDNERGLAGFGIRLAGSYIEDAAISASRYGRRKRDAYAELVADLQADTFGAQVLAFWEPSRGSRRLSEWALLLELLELRNVLVYVHTHGRMYDMANYRDRRSLQEDGVDSESDSAKTSLRVLRSVQANIAQGRPHGRVPYGYRRDYDVTPSGRRILVGQVPDPETAPVVLSIFDDIVEGHSLRSIALRLRRDGVPTVTGGEWTAARVGQIARNPVYAALRSYQPGANGRRQRRNEELTEGNWTPLVARETYYAVRDLLTQPERRSSRPGRARYLLTLIATCGVCGAHLGCRYKRDERRDTRQYWCIAGSHVWANCDDLDGYMTDILLARLARPDQYKPLTSGTEAQAQPARDELAQLRAHHADLTAAMAGRKISVAAFTTAEPAILADITAAEQRLARIQLPPDVSAFLAREGTLREAWDNAEVSVRRGLMRAYFSSITLGRPPGRDGQKMAMLTLRGTAPDGTPVSVFAGAPYEWGAVARDPAGTWTVRAKGWTEAAVTRKVRRLVREGQYADVTGGAVIPIANDPMLPQRVAFAWRQDEPGS